MKKKIQFELSEKAFVQFEDISKNNGMSGAETVRSAIRLYAWMIRKRKEGFEIVLRKDRRLDVVRLPLVGLE